MTGRFLSEDPIGFMSGDTNFYRYVGNNPIRDRDPSGKLSPGSIAFCGLAIAAGELYDSAAGIKEGADLAQTWKAEINIEIDKLTKQCQKDALTGAAGAYTPGVGTLVGGAARVAALIFF